MRKKWFLLLIPIVVFLLTGALLLSVLILSGDQTAQHAASRWSDRGDAAQVSVFVSEKNGLTPTDIFGFREQVTAALRESDITATATKQVFLDGYSAKGTLSLSSARTSSDFDAYGVGGNFFFFHPLTLVNGSYFTEDSLSNDCVLLDEDAAWQLFGGTDIAGMEVTVNHVPLRVLGVIQRDDSAFSKASGNTAPTVYVPYNTLVNYGETTSITCYELVMPNLTTGYAKQLVTNLFSADRETGNPGTEAVSETETEPAADPSAEIVENSSRYTIPALLKVCKSIGTRSMKTTALVYPYWENQARGVEDICALLLAAAVILTVLFLIYILSISIYFFQILHSKTRR